MHDINPMTEAKKPIKKIIVCSPKQCPFRYTAAYYNGEEDYCGYLKSLHKTVEKRMTIGNHNFSYEDDADASCCCTDERWIEGCPLLNSSFIVEKN